MASKLHADGVQVETVQQVVGGNGRPLVSGPAPRSGASIINPTLETPASPFATKHGFAAGIGEANTCWEADRFGTNDATFVRVRSAHSGQWADQITVSQYSSGDANLIVAQDIGTCSIQVQPGYDCHLSGWYTGTAPARLDVFYLNTVTGWRYWASSPYSAPAPGWRQITWTPPRPETSA